MFDMAVFAWAVVAIAIASPLLMLFVSREGDVDAWCRRQMDHGVHTWLRGRRDTHSESLPLGVYAAPDGGSSTADAVAGVSAVEHFDDVCGGVSGETPPHYDHDIQPWDAMQAWMTREQYIGYLRGNAIKYLARLGHKGPEVDDATKALRYIERLVAVMGDGSNYFKD